MEDQLGEPTGWIYITNNIPNGAHGLATIMDIQLGSALEHIDQQ